MSEIVSIKTESTVEVTPDILARVFWNMSDIEQAEFFHALHGIVSDAEKADGYLYGLGELQWCSLGRCVKERSPEAWNMFLAVSAFAYDYWPQKPEIFPYEGVGG